MGEDTIEKLKIKIQELEDQQLHRCFTIRCIPMDRYLCRYDTGLFSSRESAGKWFNPKHWNMSFDPWKVEIVEIAPFLSKNPPPNLDGRPELPYTD